MLHSNFFVQFNFLKILIGKYAINVVLIGKYAINVVGIGILDVCTDMVSVI